MVLAFQIGLVAGCAEPDGAALYADYCGLCHGYQGEGYLADRANALADPDFLALADDAFLRQSTARGRPGTSMSAWSEAHDGPLQDEEIDAIVGFVRGWAERDPVDLGQVEVGEGDPEPGATRYALDCAGCHGLAGEGASALSLANPEFLAIVDPAFLWLSIADGRPGAGMPAYRDELDANEIDNLVALIRSWE